VGRGSAPGLEVAISPRRAVAAIASGLDPVVVDVWDLEHHRWIVAFDTALSPFGGRLAVADAVDRPIVIAGAWGVPGVRGHEATTGEILWERRDVVRSGPVTSSVAGPNVAVGSAYGPLTVLDVRDGSTVARVRGARSAAWSRDGRLAVVERTGWVDLVDTEEWVTRWRVPIDGFAVLSMAFSGDRVVISPAVDPDLGQRAALVCLDLAGVEVWRRSLPRDRSCPAIAWVPDRGEWVALESDHERRSETQLSRIDQEGHVIDQMSIEPPGDVAIGSDGRWLVTADRHVIETGTFATVHLGP
jgi:hypothetical protein